MPAIDIQGSGSSPTIATIAHSFGTQGETITNFAVDGSNFQPTSTLSFSGTGISVNSYSLRTNTLIVASLTVATDAIPGPQNIIVSNGSQQSVPGGPFTVLKAPSGQIVLTPRNALQIRSVLLTPALPSTSCENTDQVIKRIRGNTGLLPLLARVRAVTGKPAQSVPVKFLVTGVNPQTFTTSTDLGGRAIFPSYVGINKGIDTITVSATVGGVNLVSDPVYVQWGQVTIAFKMPLPNKRGSEALPLWTVTTSVNDPSDVNHQCNGYYSLDLVDETPGSEAPVLVPLDGTVTTISLDPPTPSSFGDVYHHRPWQSG